MLNMLALQETVNFTNQHRNVFIDFLSISDFCALVKLLDVSVLWKIIEIRLIKSV